MTKFDYTKKYYKVMNAAEVHHGYWYKQGLNILKEPFDSNPEHSCVKGGFYFTDYQNLPNFFEYGIYIREVRIPKDAQVVKDPQGNKWRANKIILGKRWHIVNDFVKWFKPEKYNWEFYSGELAKFCPENFDLWFDREKYNYQQVNMLAIYCGDKFDKWFDKEKIYALNEIWVLTRYCSDKFDKWFDKTAKELIKRNSYYFAKYCGGHFKKWFSPKTFEYSGNLDGLAVGCPQYFHLWFKPKYINWEMDSRTLAKYCPQHFDEWFDPNTFGWKWGLWALEKYCAEHRKKWKKYIPKEMRNK